jgi:dTDP-4-amino-4,6-dideoxygalactose transaminase
MTIRVTKTAVDPTTARAPSLFYDSARAGMLDFLEQRLAAQPGLRVLLPSFIGWSPHEGSGVFDPVRELDLAATFYRVHDDLSVDVADLEAHLEDGGPAVVVVIHYFGRTDPALAQVASIVGRHDAVLVEDLAHGFFTARGDGPAARFGGVLLYSLHKMFPTPESRGGMVTYPDASLVTRQASTRPDLAGFLLDYDWREIGERRRAHYADLEQRLRALAADVGGFDLLWPELPAHDVPQTLPVRIHGSGRDEIYTAMNAEGYGMVSLYHTLIPELREIPEMMALATTVINFPVHQDMRADQREALVASFAASLAARSAE